MAVKGWKEFLLKFRGIWLQDILLSDNMYKVRDIEYEFLCKFHFKVAAL